MWRPGPPAAARGAGEEQEALLDRVVQGPHSHRIAGDEQLDAAWIPDGGDVVPEQAVRSPGVPVEMGGEHVGGVVRGAVDPEGGSGSARLSIRPSSMATTPEAGSTIGRRADLDSGEMRVSAHENPAEPSIQVSTTSTALPGARRIRRSSRSGSTGPPSSATTPAIAVTLGGAAAR